jgi:hypothetical protein
VFPHIALYRYTQLIIIRLPPGPGALGIPHSFKSRHPSSAPRYEHMCVAANRRSKYYCRAAYSKTIKVHEITLFCRFLSFILPPVHYNVGRPPPPPAACDKLLVQQRRKCCRSSNFIFLEGGGGGNCVIGGPEVDRLTEQVGWSL